MHGERGSVTIAHVYATGLSLLLFTVVANLVVHQYGHGVLRAAVDEAARAAARTVTSDEAAAAACRQAGERVTGSLLGARLGEDTTLACSVEGGSVTATAVATFRGWVAFVPDWEVEVAATVVRETVP